MKSSSGPGSALIDLSRSVRGLVMNDSDLNDFFENQGVGVPRLRTAMDYGEVYECQVANVVESFGLPFIRATRIVSNDSIFKEVGASLLLTRWAYNYATKISIWRPDEFQETETLEISGIEPSRIPCFVPKD